MQKEHKGGKVYKEKKRKELKRKLDTRKKRTNKQRAITSCKSPNLRPVKQKTTKKSKQLVSQTIIDLKSLS